MVHLKLPSKELCAGFFTEIIVYISTSPFWAPPTGPPLQGPLLGPRGAAEAEARLSGSGCRLRLGAAGLLRRLSGAGFRAWISWISAGFRLDLASGLIRLDSGLA